MKLNRKYLVTILTLIGFDFFCIAGARCSHSHEIIEFVTAENGNLIFPMHWMKSPINLEYKFFDSREKNRAEKIAKKAISKYPKDLIHANLKKLYFLGGLSFSGIQATGTSSLDSIYIVDRGIPMGFDFKDVELTIHSEFSALLLRKHRALLDIRNWNLCNPEGFSYLGGGVSAVSSGKDNVDIGSAKLSEGFICEYSKASLEEDFCEISARLFQGDERLWKISRKHPRIRKKMELAVNFFHSLDPVFTNEYFKKIKSMP